MKFRIETQWDGRPVDHEAVVLSLEKCPTGMRLDVKAPFFNDPRPPPLYPPGKPCPKLWEFEVVEAFFLNNKNQYLEVEFGPHGHHLVLRLDGSRNLLEDELDVEFTASIEGGQWAGSAIIPSHYFPPAVSRFNAYAIHAAGDGRCYEALYPVPSGKYSDPDFHNLDYFQAVDLSDLLPGNRDAPDTWKTLMKTS